ncbi:hypothetical protein [Pseudomonas sp. Q11]|uniref:hypothetical protein n=1 Tax=Pseudomonas sp. Q11 TaxID=2968470 RepID=UPI00210C9C31|nr:hypothetical protein [Pseudomonas sp. Q11]MCQ6258294.1 hypothetical protein [Pseudomonas sp. Q11]
MPRLSASLSVVALLSAGKSLRAKEPMQRSPAQADGQGDRQHSSAPVSSRMTPAGAALVAFLRT